MAISPRFGQIGCMPQSGWTPNGGSTPPIFGPYLQSLVVIGATYDASGGAVSVSDLSGTFYTPLTEKVSVAGGFNVKARLWFATNVNILLNHTFTFSGLNSYIQGFVFGFDNVSNSPFDTETGAGSASGTIIQPGIITPNVAGELEVTVASMTLPNSAFDAVGGVFSLTFNNPGIAGQRVPGGFAFKLNAGIENPTWSWTGSAGAAVVAAAFKPIPDPDFVMSIDAKRI